MVIGIVDRQVRIDLPPSRLPGLQSRTGRHSQRETVTLKPNGRVVLPSNEVEDAEEQPRIRSGSKWRHHDLAPDRARQMRIAIDLCRS